MPLYEYRCPECGIIERSHGMNSAPTTECCPGCGNEARRVISAPRLKQVSPQLVRARDAAEKSRDEPEVVRREPGTERVGRSRPDPGLERLVGRESARHMRTVPHPASRPHRH
ncbi:FmdB family zinc ribbon protein [Saccharomonospora halophila]|uniref:FmdB family zinc ribbon protein n=1 Tax=Saccharomonospora halophila TaxID=129922 RepID=UPI0004921CCA|nr:zinc ribbon domain-containing protein [Saccharomonospora halophila]